MKAKAREEELLPEKRLSVILAWMAFAGRRGGSSR